MYRSRKFRRAALIVGASVSLLAAPGARAETLIQALVQAYQTNPQILAARDLLRSTDEQVAQAISLLRPTATATFTGGFATGTTSTLNTAGREVTSGSRTRPASASLTLSQPIYRGGKEYAEIKKAENTIRAQRARLHNTEQDIFFQVVTAYMNVVRDEALLRLQENNVVVLQRQLQAVRDRFNVGEVTRTDVAQAEAAVAGAVAQRVLAQGNLENSRATYQSLVGHRPVRLSEPRPPAFLPARFDIVLAGAKANNPTIIAATYDEFAARNNVRSIIGELLPQVSLNGSVSRNLDSGQPDTRTSGASLTVTVTVPLYESGSVYSRTRAAKQTVFQRGNDLAQARRAVEQSATQAWSTLLAARASVRSFQEQTRANAVALEGVRQENQAGLRTVLDVLTAQQTLLNSQASLVSSRRDVIVASYQVAQSMGRLTAMDLRLPVLIYDATAYYRAIKYLPFGTGPSLGAPPPKPRAAPPSDPGATTSARPPQTRARR